MKRLLMTLLVIITLIIGPTTLSAEDCGDVNDDGKVNLLDVSYTINYLYRGGPAPNCGPETGTVTDMDGNLYYTIKIGNQWWMMENLRVSHYLNGDEIPNVIDNITWGGLTSGAYCEYNDDANNVATYGRLYNWYAATDIRKIAPAGWHVPSETEWQTLCDYLGGNDAAGGTMKQVGSTHWSSPNTGATNESSFLGLPGGYRNDYGNYSSMNLNAFFWSSVEYSISNAWGRSLVYDSPSCFSHGGSKVYGFSIRCVKD